MELRALLFLGGGEKGNPPQNTQHIFKVERLKKKLFLLKGEKITIVLLAGSVGNVPKEHNWINYIFIFCIHSSMRTCTSM